MGPPAAGFSLREISGSLYAEAQCISVGEKLALEAEVRRLHSYTREKKETAMAIAIGIARDCGRDALTLRLKWRLAFGHSPAMSHAG